MPSITRKWCRRCGDYGPATGGANHVLHLLLTLFTVGLWLPIWILAAISPSYSCNRCGGRTGISSAWLWLVGFSVAGLALWKITNIQ